VERESKWTNKSSTAVQCKRIMEEIEAEDKCFIPTPTNCATYEATLRVEKPKILKAAKAKVAQLFRRKAEEEAAKVPFQGELLSLMAEEKADISWQSLIYRVPRGVMGWAIRACTQTLATPDNLQRWGVRVDPKCSLEGCGQPCTLGHLLSSCTFSLNRFKYRHDSCLQFILENLIKKKPSGISISADLPGWRVGEGQSALTWF
jgi:hypothetical protein